MASISKTGLLPQCFLRCCMAIRLMPSSTHRVLKYKNLAFAKVLYVLYLVRYGTRHRRALAEVIDGAIDGATKGVKDKLKLLLKAIVKDEDKRTPFYESAANLDESDGTIERYMQQLREADLIEFKGDAAQTGGYFLKDAVKQLLDSKKS